MNTPRPSTGPSTARRRRGNETKPAGLFWLASPRTRHEHMSKEKVQPVQDSWRLTSDSNGTNLFRLVRDRTCWRLTLEAHSSAALTPADAILAAADAILADVRK